MTQKWKTPSFIALPIWKLLFFTLTFVLFFLVFEFGLRGILILCKYLQEFFFFLELIWVSCKSSRLSNLGLLKCWDYGLICDLWFRFQGFWSIKAKALRFCICMYKIIALKLSVCMLFHFVLISILVSKCTVIHILSSSFQSILDSIGLAALIYLVGFLFCF